MTSSAAVSDSAPADDLRPTVGGPVSNRGAWLFAGLLVAAAIGLFAALEGRRAAIVSPATAPPIDGVPGLISTPPDLVVPGVALNDAGYFGAYAIPLAATVPSFVPQTLPGVPRTPRVAQPGMIPGPPIAGPPAYYDPGSPDAPFRPGLPQTPALALDESKSEAGLPVPGSLAGNRVRATTFLNPSLTVPQGTVIPAVLETALDSNRPGFVRAIVSRDVRGFDGNSVLIPRGSRLFGEYKSDLGQGQKRVFVQWQKLTRPDGVQVALDSPAADPLGRAGIGGKVNTHFWTRFGNAMLQSALDIGVGLATRSASGDTLVLGLPGSTQNLIQPNQESLKPTVSVKHGTSVSVFVARDLDFSTVQ